MFTLFLFCCFYDSFAVCLHFSRVAFFTIRLFTLLLFCCFSLFFCLHFHFSRLLMFAYNFVFYCFSVFTILLFTNSLFPGFTETNSIKPLYKVNFVDFYKWCKWICKVLSFRFLFTFQLLKSRVRTDSKNSIHLLEFFEFLDFGLFLQV